MDLELKTLKTVEAAEWNVSLILERRELAEDLKLEVNDINFLNISCAMSSTFFSSLFVDGDLVLLVVELSAEMVR